MTYEIDTVAKTIKLTSNVTFKEVRELEKMFPGFTLAPANGIQWVYPSYQPVFPENPTYVTGSYHL